MVYYLLNTLCSIHAPSGNEVKMRDFLLAYVQENKKSWNCQPQIIEGAQFQDCLILVFGKPKTAVFAHIDSIGFTVRYNNELVKIGGPAIIEGMRLRGEDVQGTVVGLLSIDEENGTLHIKAGREIERGTELVFEHDFRETAETVQCCYLDNRLGVFAALQLAETLTNGAIVFSCYEEHGGGTVAYLARYLQQQYSIQQALIADITWVTEGVKAGEGVVISLRDSLIPRRSYVNKIIRLAKESGIKYQLEVEGSGGSDAKELQFSEMPWDWCFIGAPEDNVHTPDEIVHKTDIESMVALYKYLMDRL